MDDSLGDRMKQQYEDRTRFSLPRRTYTIIRVDGKAFHTLTKQAKFKKPFDPLLMSAMDAVALKLVKEIQGSVFAFVQSDEVSVLATDFAKNETNAWFDGNIQKIVSVSASVATMTFNKFFVDHSAAEIVPSALFDARCFTIPDPTEVYNYSVWRQKDAERNSVQMLARSLYSHKELNGKSTAQLKEMCLQKGQDWHTLLRGEQRGRSILKSNLVEDYGTWYARGAYPFVGCCDELHHLIKRPGAEPEDEKEVTK